MVWPSLVTAAVAPGLALLAYFYLKDRYDSEPVHMVIRMFMLGVLLVFPTMVLQRGFILGTGENEFLFAFAISGGVEEFLKWFVIYNIIYTHAVFDEPYDGIVYCVAISLGFATLENVIYALVHRPSFSGLLFRAFLPVSGHALFGVIMGYYLGQAKFIRERERKYLWLSLLLPIVWHGAFDYILLVLKAYWIWAILPLMSYLWGKSLWKVQRANARSPFRSIPCEEGD